MSQHQCGKFTYENDFGAEVLTDPAIYPLNEVDLSRARPVDENHIAFDAEFKSWNFIDVHNCEPEDGTTSGHVYRIVGRGVQIGCVVLQW